MGSIEYPKLRNVEAFPVEVEGQTRICLKDPAGFADGPILVPASWAFILSLLDGTNSLLDIQTAYTRRFGTLLFREDLEAFLKDLDRKLFLDTSRFEAERKRIAAEFARSSLRKSILAEPLLQGSPEECARNLDSLFLAPEGPGKPEDVAPSSSKLAGLIVPHIDLGRGGPLYAWGYRELLRSGPPDVAIILGTAHSGIGQRFALTRKDFETPLGLVRNASRLSERLIKEVGGWLLDDEFAHRSEHSIELQALWLKHLFPDIAILPLLVRSPLEGEVKRASASGEKERANALLDALRRMVSSEDLNPIVIASADLSHIGERFGDNFSVTPALLGRLKAEDLETISAIEKGDAEGFLASVSGEKEWRRVCGVGPIWGLLRIIERPAGRLLKYHQAADPACTVTFAAIAVEAQA